MGRVLYDGQVFTQQARGGVSRYFVNLARAVDRVEGWEAWVSLGAHVLEEVPEDLGLRKPALKMPTTRGVRVRRWLNRGVMAATRPRPDGQTVYHPTWYDLGTIDIWSNLPIVLTVHDLIPETWPQASATAEIANRADSFGLARTIVCVSQTTCDVFVDRFPELEDRAVVCRPGLSPLPPGSQPSTPGSYLVHVGKRGGYKDFVTLLKGVVLLPREVTLVAVGGEPVTATEGRMISELGLNDRVDFRPDVTDQQLADLLAGASALVSVSRAEGFGFPPIEAAAQSTPSILTDIPAYIEIHSRWAEFFPVGDHEAFAEVATKVLSSKKRELPSPGAIKEEFSWMRAAEHMAQIYESALR